MASCEPPEQYAQTGESSGKPIWKHEAIGHYLAYMAKLLASETAMEIALNAIRIHGGYGYST